MKREHLEYALVSIVLGCLLTNPASGAPQRADATIERLPGVSQSVDQRVGNSVSRETAPTISRSIGPPCGLPSLAPAPAPIPRGEPVRLAMGPPRALTPPVINQSSPPSIHSLGTPPDLIALQIQQNHGAALVKMMPPVFLARLSPPQVGAPPVQFDVGNADGGQLDGMGLAGGKEQDGDERRVTNDIMQLIHQARQEPALGTNQVMRLSIAELIGRTLANSKNIEILRLRPIEFRQSVASEYGRFDWSAFVENRVLHGQVPVQSSNEVNGLQPVIRQEELEIRWGVRKNTTLGGTLELGDSIGMQDDDSGILQPPDQGLARLSLNYQQELLRNAGRDINLSPALVASLQADSEHDTSVADISQQLQLVVNAYWQLFEARGQYFVWKSLVTWAEDILDALEDRRDIDAQENLISQARALQLEAQAEAAQARIQVLIAQDRLRRLVNDPMLENERVEIIPIELPEIAQAHRSVPDELSIALQNRGEIHSSLKEIKVAATRHNVSVNQLLPRLTFVLESSLNGLNGGDDIGRARENAFEHDPLIQAELNLEFFLGNRRARALVRQADIAMARLRVKYEDDVEQVKLEVREAVRTLNGSNSILDLRYRTLDQRAAELDYLSHRYRVIPEEGASVSLQIEEYFLALNRIVASQLEYFKSLSNQQQAVINLERAKGMLVRSIDVPYDAKPPVPSWDEAFDLQKRNKPHILGEEIRSVVKPNLIPY